MTKVYISADVADVLALHPYLEERAFKAAPIRDQIDQQARTLLKAHGAGDERVSMQICSWWPGAASLSPAKILETHFDQSDAHLTLSREYGFDSWEDVVALGDLTPDPDFENALDSFLCGDVAALTASLETKPNLATAASRFGHRATLLHYVAANGVESYRQRVPMNAPDIARLLISRGANPAAHANMYGGRQTPLMLAKTSAHPYKAGIAEALNEVLATH